MSWKSKLDWETCRVGAEWGMLHIIMLLLAGVLIGPAVVELSITCHITQSNLQRSLM